MLKKILKIVGALAVLAVVAGALSWHFYWKPGLLMEQARYGNLQWFATSVIRFNSDYHRLPKNLDEMLKTGYLPEKSSYYLNPMKHFELGTPPEASYKESEFELVFQSTSVAISIPEKDFTDPYYRFVKGSWRTWYVTGDVELYDPKRDRAD